MTPRWLRPNFLALGPLTLSRLGSSLGVTILVKRPREACFGVEVRRDGGVFLRAYVMPWYASWWRGRGWRGIRFARSPDS